MHIVQYPQGHGDNKNASHSKAKCLMVGNVNAPVRSGVMKRSVHNKEENER